MKELEKIIARTLCFMHPSFFPPYYIFNNNAYFSDFRAQKFPLIFFNVNPFKHQQALHFGVLNYEKQHKEGTCKVSGRSVVLSAFYADFCLCPKSVIITTLNLSSYKPGLPRSGKNIWKMIFSRSGKSQGTMVKVREF